MSTQPDSPMLPDLVFRAPDCPLCGMETNPVDGAFDCESCNLTWSSDDRTGQRQDPQLPQCLAQCRPHDELASDGTPRWASLHGRAYTCVLDAGHGERIDPRSHQPVPHRGVCPVESWGYVDTHVWEVVEVPA